MFIWRCAKPALCFPLCRVTISEGVPLKAWGRCWNRTPLCSGEELRYFCCNLMFLACHLCPFELQQHPINMPQQASAGPFLACNAVAFSEALLCHKTGSGLGQVMACCLMAPCHYLNQCSLIIMQRYPSLCNDIQWHSAEAIFTLKWVYKMHN